MDMNRSVIDNIQTYLKKVIREKFGGKIPQYSFFEEYKSKAKDELQVVLSVLGLDGLDPVSFDALYKTSVNEYLSTNPVEIEPVNTLTRKGLISWLTPERIDSITWNYRDRYISYLRRIKRADKVITETLTSSELILSKMGDPKSKESFFIKGLVVGSVQSGKTANFNAVINQAVDAGYGLIIVLSGIMEDLRGQTQLRIENDVIGEGLIDISSGKKSSKGVGEIRRFGEQGDKINEVPQVFSITSYKMDFNKALADADFSLNNKNILICKKNHRILANLIIWLYQYLAENKEKHDIPLLVVDDEADNASLNNLGHKGREEATRINGHIRALLSLFTKKTYLGYTATPFANVLQDRNDFPVGKWYIQIKGRTEPLALNRVDNIFPDDFIVLLNPPSNYIGAKQIFETVFDEEVQKIPLVEIIDDNYAQFPEKVVDLQDGTSRPIQEGDENFRNARREDLYPERLPASLKDAVKCFILSIALRLSRKPGMVDSEFYNPHHSMLIHVSRFIPWQNRTYELIQNYLNALISDVKNDLPNNPASVYGKLEKIWNKYLAYIVENMRDYLPVGYSDEFMIPKTYSEIKPLLIESIRNIEVKALNSSRPDKLEYTKDSLGNGKKYIVIGGNKLSRGFTLEGLTINYFIRNTNFSDTLLQMGRWFGYRPGYLDCCKIFTTPHAIEKFDSTTRTIEELEIEFKKMELKNKSPREFELRVRTHPGTLKVTRPSILKKTTEIKWSYQDQLEQTTKFDLIPDKINAAWNSFNTLISEYVKDLKAVDDFWCFRSNKDGLFRFMDIANAFHNYSDIFNQIKMFVQLCVTQQKLVNWTIAVRRNGAARKLSDLNLKTSMPLDIFFTTRSGPGPGMGFYRQEFLNNKVFSASGKSANIVTRGADLSILLDAQTKKEAEEDFIEGRIDYYMKKLNLTRKEAEEKVRSITFPERIYRERMSDQDGLLLIYLIDLETVFRKSEKDDELLLMAQTGNFNLDIPLIGYAFGFPPISPDPGGIYVKGDYNLDIDEESTEQEEDIVFDADEVEIN